LEGGVAMVGNEAFSFAWMAVLRADGVWGEARSAAFRLPPRVAALLQQGYELGEADDRVFGEENSKQKMGAVGLLTDGLIDRATLYEHALVLALIPYGKRWQEAQ
jgi:non-canonical (house-cleaning) NTP pyrophosphatase